MKGFLKNFATWRVGRGRLRMGDYGLPKSFSSPGGLMVLPSFPILRFILFYLYKYFFASFYTSYLLGDCTYSLLWTPQFHSFPSYSLIWTPQFSTLDSTFSNLDSTFWLDSMLRISLRPASLCKPIQWSELRLLLLFVSNGRDQLSARS